MTLSDAEARVAEAAGRYARALTGWQPIGLSATEAGEAPPEAERKAVYRIPKNESTASTTTIRPTI